VRIKALPAAVPIDAAVIEELLDLAAAHATSQG
jgi:hypothetical protein